MDQRIQNDLAEVPFEFDWTSFDKLNCNVKSYGFQPEEQESITHAIIFIELSNYDVNAKIEATLYNTKGAIVADSMSENRDGNVVKIAVRYRSSEKIELIKISLPEARDLYVPQSFNPQLNGEDSSERDYTKINIEELDLSIRVYKRLRRVNIRTVNDIQKKLLTQEDFCSIKGLGPKGMQEILDRFVFFKIPHPMITKENK